MAKAKQAAYFQKRADGLVEHSGTGDLYVVMNRADPTTVVVGEAELHTFSYHSTMTNPVTTVQWPAGQMNAVFPFAVGNGLLIAGHARNPDENEVEAMNAFYAEAEAAHTAAQADAAKAEEAAKAQAEKAAKAAKAAEDKEAKAAEAKKAAASAAPGAAAPPPPAAST